MDTSKSDDILDISGPKDQSLFYHAKLSLVKGKIKDIQARLDERWQHYSKVKDDRLVALIAALCIESSIDVLLTAVAPGFLPYAEDTDFTFSVKIKIARSLRLIPGRILKACDLIRQIRNEFAHHVHYKRFEDLPEDKYLNKLEPYVRNFNNAKRDPKEVQRLFKELVSFTLLALIIYTEQVSRLREFIETDAGRASFYKWCEENQASAQSASTSNS